MKLSLDAGFANRWLWLCPLLGVALAAFALAVFGLSWWSALVAAALLVCPALILWALVTTARDARHAGDRGARR